MVAGPSRYLPCWKEARLPGSTYGATGTGANRGPETPQASGRLPPRPPRACGKRREYPARRATCAKPGSCLTFIRDVKLPW